MPSSIHALISAISSGLRGSPFEGMRSSGSLEVISLNSVLPALSPGFAASSSVVRVLIENPPLASCPEWQREHLFFNSGWISFWKSTACSENAAKKNHAKRMREGYGTGRKGQVPPCSLFGRVGACFFIGQHRLEGPDDCNKDYGADASLPFVLKRCD